MQLNRSLLSLLLLVLAGCGPKHADLMPVSPPRPVQYADEAARSGLAVISVAPWEEYVAGLQPTFSLTADQALLAAMPVTMRQQSQLLDALNVGLRLAPPTSSVSSSLVNTGTRDATGSANSSQSASQSVTTTSGTAPATEQTQTSSTTSSAQANTSSDTTGATQTRTATRAAGDLSAITLPGAPTLPAALVPAVNPLSGALDSDPITRYGAAAALFQEVQLLNRYVRDAALKTNSKAMLVRLQLTLLPQVRNQAWDAYSTLSFLASEHPAEKKAIRPVLNPYTQLIGGLFEFPKKATASEQTSATPAPGATPTANTPEDAATSGGKQRVPIVIPLLVTDSIEQTVAATAESRLRSISAALLAMQQGFGASAEFGRQIEALQAALGSDMNSLLTISKVATNVLRVRLGAVQSVGSGLAMQARNHKITVLVLVPKGGASDQTDYSVDVLSKLEIMNAIDGARAKDRPYDVLASEVRTVVCKYTVNCPQGERGALDQEAWKDVDKLVYAVQREDSDAVDSAAEKLGIQPASKLRIWTDVLEVLGKSPYTATSFDVPPDAKAPEVEDQSIAVIDDGTRSIVDLRGLRGDVKSTLVAALNINKGLMATSITSTSVESSGNVVRLAFPSVQKLKICDDSTPPCTVTVELFWTKPADRWTMVNPDFNRVRKFEIATLISTAPVAKAETVAFQIRATGRTIVRNGLGTGAVRLTFQRDEKSPDEDMFFSVDGADVKSVEPSASANFGAKGWVVRPAVKTDPVTITIQLENLTEDADVRITGNNGKAQKEPVTFRVRTGKVP